MRLVLGSALALGAASWLLPACEADLESECIGGDGTCDGHPMGGPVTVGSTSGGGGAGAGGGPVCFEGCDPETASGKTGEFPCEVEAVMDNCRRCHTTPLASSAPFPLDTYEESQALYATKAVWFRAHAAVKNGIMPLSEPFLTPAEKAVMLDWSCQCGPPRGAGVTCD